MMAAGSGSLRIKPFLSLLVFENYWTVHQYAVWQQYANWALFHSFTPALCTHGLSILSVSIDSP
jgi:hypothetical protein